VTEKLTYSYMSLNRNQPT